MEHNSLKQPSPFKVVPTISTGDSSSSQPLSNELVERIANIDLKDEDTSKVLCRWMPRTEEFSEVIYASQNTGKLYSSDFQKAQLRSNLAWSEMYSVMARCIARGMRIQSNLIAASNEQARKETIKELIAEKASGSSVGRITQEIRGEERERIGAFLHGVYDSQPNSFPLILKAIKELENKGE